MPNHRIDWDAVERAKAGLDEVNRAFCPHGGCAKCTPSKPPSHEEFETAVGVLAVPDRDGRERP